MHETIVMIEKLDAPLEKVWSALTEARELKQWYFDIPDFSLDLNHVFNFYEPGGENKFHHQGEILEVIPREKLKYSWGYPEFTKDHTIVCWELKARGEHTLLTFTHKGLENFKHLGEGFSLSSFQGGWKAIIEDSLKTYLEK